MLNSMFVSSIIRLSLQEDLSFGDITTELLIPKDSFSNAMIIAKEDLIVCGIPIIEKIFNEYGSELDITNVQKEGKKVKKGEVICEIKSKTQALLQLERTILNFLQRLSGVATYTNNLVSEFSGMQILDTRKTLPGWRVLDKYACTIGGAKNHRISLGDMILVKNNHLDFFNNFDSFIEKILNRNNYYTPVEIEVRTLEELTKIIKAKPDIIMLDNMNIDEIKECLKFIENQNLNIKIEISGGINKERLEELRQLSKKFSISMGSLTTQARNVDISMNIQNC